MKNLKVLEENKKENAIPDTVSGAEKNMMDDLDILPEDLDRRIARTKMQISALERLMKTVLKPGIDYDIVLKTGSDAGSRTMKPTLLLDGAHQICQAFHLRPEFTIETKTEDRTVEPPFLSYFCRCRLYHRPTEMLVAEGIGAANSYESRYRYRWVEAPAEEQKRWQEFKNLPGYRSKKIEGRWVLHRRVENPDIFDLQNTLVKMAKKREYVDATLNATGASRLFTQDFEDIGHPAADELEYQPAAYQPPSSPPPAKENGRNSKKTSEPNETKTGAAENGRKLISTVFKIKKIKKERSTDSGYCVLAEFETQTGSGLIAGFGSTAYYLKFYEEKEVNAVVKTNRIEVDGYTAYEVVKVYAGNSLTKLKGKIKIDVQNGTVYLDTGDKTIELEIPDPELFAQTLDLEGQAVEALLDQLNDKWILHKIQQN